MAEATTQGQAMAKTQATKSPASEMNRILNAGAMQELVKSALREKAGLFTASVLDLYSSDKTLQKCEASAVAREAMKAATLDLPLNKNLGFAWLVPYNQKQGNGWISVPQFQIGWRGIVQLAQRTSMYRFLNAGPVYEGELRRISKLTGEIDIDGEAASDKVVGFFAFFEMINGFKKASFWTTEKVTAHAIRYNPECRKAGKLTGVWLSHFEERATATVLKHLIKNYGIMSVEMQSIASALDETTSEEAAARDIAENANSEVIGFTAEVITEDGEAVDRRTGEVMQAASKGPGDLNEPPEELFQQREAVMQPPY
jgi:recombination protein RecT